MTGPVPPRDRMTTENGAEDDIEKYFNHPENVDKFFAYVLNKTGFDLNRLRSSCIFPNCSCKKYKEGTHYHAICKITGKPKSLPQAENFEQFVIKQINNSYNEYKGSNEAVLDAAHFIAAKHNSLLKSAVQEMLDAAKLKP